MDHTYSHGICTVCGDDAVSVTAENGTVTFSSDMLKNGTVILFACYDSSGRMISARSRIWDGGLVRQ